MAQNDLNNGRGVLGFEADLFKAADKLRGNMLPKFISGDLRINGTKKLVENLI